MSIHGIHLDTTPPDPGLMGTLHTDHMERYRAPRKTVMINAWQDDLPWLIVDSTYPAQIRRRHQLLADRYQMVIGRLPGHEVGLAEHALCRQVVEYLLGSYPDYFTLDGSSIHCLLTGITVDLGPQGADPLAAISVLATEDFLILLPESHELQGHITHVLKAGALLFPNGWGLRSCFAEARPDSCDKRDLGRWEAARQASLHAARLGKSPYEIHDGHVSHYMEHFAHRVDRFLMQMKPGMRTWRRNWAVQLSDELFLHSDAPPLHLPEPTPGNWEHSGYLRCEQQTFARVPGTAAVVFTIKTYLWKLSDVVENPLAMHALIDADAHLAPAMFDYRSASLRSFRQFLELYKRRV